MKKQIQTKAAPASPAILSQAIEVDGLVFVSGQIHLKTDMTLVAGSVSDKVEQIMSNILAILNAAGLELSDIIKATVYVTDMGNYKEFNEAYVTYFKSPMPAREVVCVKELPLEADFEISVIAKR